MSEIPDSLKSAVKLASETLIEDDDNHLQLGVRRSIWFALDEGDSDVGHKRRVKLAIIGSKKVLHVWNNLWSDNELPQTALALASQVIDGDISRQEAQKQYDHMWREIEELASIDDYQSSHYQRGVCAGLAAIAALRTALHDEQFGEAIDISTTDEQIDSFDTDSALWASSAYAGATWDEDSIKQRRFEYWTWWLDGAVAEAYASDV